EYPCNFTYERQFEKIKAVTDELTKAFGKRPTSFRAGKFGFNEDTKNILERLGYIVDSSVTPMVSWTGNNGPSFLDYRARPFYFAETGIFEIPVTIGLNRNISRISENIFLHIPKFTRIRGLLSKDYLNLVDLIWLYPAMFSEKEMISLVETMIQKSINVFNMFFHSNEIKAGESIYTKTEDELERYLRRLEIFFDYAMNEKRMESVTLSEYRESHN
ncbi:MAG: hypothetical protein ACE5IH_09595, partial [Thermodesulfobacteriota bacterium]